MFTLPEFLIILQDVRGFLIDRTVANVLLAAGSMMTAIMLLGACLLVLTGLWYAALCLWRTRNSWMEHMEVPYVELPEEIPEFNGFASCPNCKYAAWVPTSLVGVHTRCDCDGVRKVTFFRHADEAALVTGVLRWVGPTLYIFEVGGDGARQFVRPIGIWYALMIPCKSLPGFVSHVLRLLWNGCVWRTEPRTVRWEHSAMMSYTGLLGKAGTTINARTLETQMNQDQPITGYHSYAQVIWFMERARVIKTAAAAVYEPDHLDVSFFLEVSTALSEPDFSRFRDPIERFVPVGGQAAVEPDADEGEGYLLVEVPEASAIKGVQSVDGHKPATDSELAREEQLNELLEVAEEKTDKPLGDAVDFDNPIITYHRLPEWSQAVQCSGPVCLSEDADGAPTGVRVDKVNPERVKRTANNGIATGLVFGHPGYVLSATTDSLVHTIKVRYATKKGVAAEQVVEVDGRNFVRYTDIPIPELPEPEGDNLGDIMELMSKQEAHAAFAPLMKNMGPSQKQRVLKVVERMFEGTASWDDLNVKIFVKGDEKLGKKKGRVIVFVPTIGWVRCIIMINNIMQRLKSREDFCHSIPSLKLHLFFGCGMNQADLSRAATRAEGLIADGEHATFICGDDNTSENMEQDASSYDTTQRGVFLEAQLGVLAAWSGQSKKWWKEQMAWHKGVRVGAGFSVNFKGTALPSGAVWTLLMNTIGMMVYVVTRQRLQQERGLTDDQVTEVVSRWYGLEMTSEQPVIRNSLHYKVFLKGVFLPYGNKTVWVPLPSRICKMGGRILDSPDDKWVNDPANLWKHAGSIASSYCTFLVDPLILGPVTRHIARFAGKTDKSFGRESAFVHEGGDIGEFLGEEDVSSSEWKATCLAWLEQRYGFTERDASVLEEALSRTGPDADGFLHMTGGVWSRLYAVDYGATPVEE